MRLTVGILAAASVLAFGSPQLRAQSATFRSTTELVGLNVSVTDQNAQPVAGLSADRFQVFEDGVRQEVKFFAPGEMPLDVVILLDTSASMTGSMGLVQQAASRFAHSLRPHDRAAVMGISSGLRVLQTFTSDLAAIDEAIKSSKPAGRTPLYASIYTALRELEKLQLEAADTPRRRAMVVLSDGHDTSSTFTFDSLLSVVRSHAVPIYTIAPRPEQSTKSLRERLFGESTAAADFELKKLASESGARSFFPVTLMELSGVYAAIASELAHQYSLGYHSSSPARASAFRRIALRVDGEGLTWRTRAGYLAEPDVASGGGADR